MSFLGAISSPSKMRRRTIVGGQIALLSLLILIALWYRDTLAETFEPIERIFPNPGESQLRACACAYACAAGN